MENNDVASFFYYMWNAWCERECSIAFEHSQCGWQHIWNKWSAACKRNDLQIFGAAEIFFSELDAENQDLLVNRAIELYNRKERIK